MSKSNGMDEMLEFLWQTEGILRQVDQRNRRTTTAYGDFADRIFPMINRYSDFRAEILACAEAALEALERGRLGEVEGRLRKIVKLQEDYVG